MDKIKELINIGKIIASNENLDIILNTILDTALELINADAGTIYLRDGDFLEFKVVKNKTIPIEKLNLPKLPLYINGKENLEMVAVVSALKDKVINIEDVYKVKEFNFEGTKNFDKRTGYRSKSMLVIPMKNHENEIIGVVQLINKKEGKFTKEDEELMLSLASQAAIVITKNNLINDLEKLLQSFLKSIATAIDEKSPFTGGHTRRVAKLTEMIVNALNEKGIKHYSKDELKEIKIAAWMHDIGKITTPDHIIDKATKLQTIFDRIEFVLAKLEILKRDEEIKFLKKEISKDEFEEKIRFYNECAEFLKEINKGQEFTSDEMIEKLETLKDLHLTIDNKPYKLLNDDEFKNLSIRKGTLSDEEIEIIKNHVVVTIKMLSEIYFPKKYKRVPEIAGAHHEKLDGSGYPKGLKDKEISFEARILALADMFEALTAADRPYKKPMKLSLAMNILNDMAQKGQIDKEIFKFFYENKIYLKYAKEELQDQEEVTLNL